MFKEFMAFMLLIVASGCSIEFKSVPDEEHLDFSPRFEVVERFKAFKESTHNSYIIRDVESGSCYMYLRVDEGYGGVGLEHIKCPGESDLYSNYEKLRNNSKQ